ncbi:MAG: aspartate kinase [Sumerlaeia bacterium]
MALIVQKFGGDALGDKGKGREADQSDLSGASLIVEKFRRVAQVVKRSRDEGHSVVAVLSAMGDTTNRLLRMAGALNPDSPARELDALMATGEMQSIALFAIALHQVGVPAMSFTGVQVGIRTDELFGRSRIREVNCDRLRTAIANGQVPIVAGFQGVSDNGDITTLGRGGSDISAVAVAAALHADACEFYKDVDGIFSTDPRIVPSALKIDRISYDEMLELASLGAGVLHSRSVEFAKNYGVPLHVRSFLHDEPGTYVIPEDKSMENVVVSGVVPKTTEARLTLEELPDVPGTAAKVFTGLADADISVDMIIQEEARGGRNSISFTVEKKDYGKALEISKAVVAELGGGQVTGDDTVAKVSAVGVGMKSHAGVAAKMFKALADANINIDMISTSEIKISVLIKEADAKRAVEVIHQAFEQEMIDAKAQAAAHRDMAEAGA